MNPLALFTSAFARRPVEIWHAAQAERVRWGLWTPVFIGIGVWGYFALPSEPGAWALLAAPLLLVLLSLPWLRRWRFPLLILFLPTLGFNAAQMESRRCMAPMLKAPVYAPQMSGRVALLEPAARGATLWLDAVEIPNLPPGRQPHKIRLSIKAAPQDWPQAGSRVALAALLMPLSEPAAPGAYDFRRDGFFNGVGAQGFARGTVRVIAPPPARPGLRPWFEQRRQMIAQRVAQRLSGDTAQIATALLNGAQGGISPQAKDNMRASGLYHIISISGLHLAVVTALLFTGLRRGLSLFPYAALYWPIKKIAALFALVVLPFYILLVGEPVPALRCALMAGVVLLGVLAERRALSLRLVALAATGLLLLAPHAMLGASFQLSFAAVTVMVAGYEALRRRRQAMLAAAVEEPKGRWQKAARLLWRYGGGMAGTSLLAGLATAPFTLFQFQQANGYGIAANMLGIPLTSFIIMPAGFISYFLMPFGMEGWALRLMGWGIDGLLAISALVAAWPGATLQISAFPVSALALIVSGGLWLCLWQEKWRYWGCAAILVGIMLACASPRPVIFLAPELANWAVRQDESIWLAAKAGARDFTVRQWRQRSGDDLFLRWDEAADPDVLRCDILGCLYRQAGKRIMFVWDAAALAEDCGHADLIVTPLWHVDCPATPVVAGSALKWQGAASIVLPDGALPDAPPRISHARARWNGRPWSPGWRGDGRTSIRQTVLTPAAESVADEIETDEDGQ